jgi:PQQ enzyme repeat
MQRIAVVFTFLLSISICQSLSPILSDRSYLVALELKTGRERWFKEIDAPKGSSFDLCSNGLLARPPHWKFTSTNVLVLELLTGELQKVEPRD